MNNFLEHLSSKNISYEELFNDIKEEINILVKNDFNFENTIFEKYPVEIKMLLQSNQELFWKFWNFCDEKQIETSTEIKDNSIIQEIRENGIYVIPQYFNEKEISLLKYDWTIAMKNFPELTKEESETILKNRFNFKTVDKINYVTGSAYDGKKRVIYTNKDTFPENFKHLLNENQEFKDFIKKYYYTDKPFFPNAIMAEELFEPKYYRDDYYWHIDNLSDQFKIMVILEDMTKDDAPFIYKNGTHKIKNEYKDRYHKMYSINGITTQESNHFEESFTPQNEEAKKAILKAGDIVLFDCKIHHTASHAKNGGNRKNIMMYYNTIPTIRNKILYKIDSYLNFALK